MNNYRRASSECAKCGCAQSLPQRDCECPAEQCDTPVMAFVPCQTGVETYNEIEALCVGTIFKTLNKPLIGKRGCCNG